MGFVRRIFIFSVLLGLNSACGKSDTVRLTLLTGLQNSSAITDFSKMVSMTLPAPLTGSTQVCRQKDLRVGFFVPSTGQEVLVPIDLLSESGLDSVYNQTGNSLSSLLEKLHFAPIQLDVPKGVQINIGLIGAITTGFTSVSSSINEGIQDCPKRLPSLNPSATTVGQTWSIRGVRVGTFTQEMSISLPVFILPSTLPPAAAASNSFFKIVNVSSQNSTNPTVIRVRSFAGPGSSGFEQVLVFSSAANAFFIPRAPRLQVDLLTLGTVPSLESWSALTTGSPPHSLITQSDFDSNGSLNLQSAAGTTIINLFQFP